MYGRGINRLCWAPRRLCMWMVLTLVNLSDKHLGTRLLAVLNIKEFNCLHVCDINESRNSRVYGSKAGLIFGKLSYSHLNMYIPD